MRKRKYETSLITHTSMPPIRIHDDEEDTTTSDQELLFCALPESCHDNHFWLQTN